jgi:hypothetical protein
MSDAATPPEVPLLVTHARSQGSFLDAYRRLSGSYSGAFLNAMTGFGVASNLQALKVIYAEGALTCAILLVHMRRGVGALGHFEADMSPRVVVGAIQQMVETCNVQSGTPGAEPIDIVLAAALIEAVPNFVDNCVAGARALYTRARVQYIEPGDGGIYGACLYAPLRYRAAFNDDGFNKGGGEGDATLRRYRFDSREAPLNR